MPPAYTTPQKNLIAQFIQITGADRALAAKALKASNWNLQLASNNYFGGPQQPTHYPALEKQFQQYRAKSQDPDKLDVAATQQYFTDLGVSFESVDVFIASQIVQSPSFGEIAKEGFIQGWTELQCDTLAKQKAQIAKHKDLLTDISNPAILDKVYKYAFTLMMQNQGQRSADKTMCIEFWKVLLSKPSLEWTTPTVQWRDVWIDFMSNRQFVKTISRDQWNHVLKFARLSLADPSLSFHNEEQSWPSIIDEFVEMARASGIAVASSSNEAMEF